MRFQLMLSPLFQIALGKFETRGSWGIQLSLLEWHIFMPVWELPEPEAQPDALKLLLVEHDKLLALVESADELVERRTKKNLEAYKVARDGFTFEDLDGPE